MDDFSLTIASDSHSGNIRRLWKPFTIISKRGREIGGPFPGLNTELIYWHTPSQRTQQAKAHISLNRSLIHPSGVVRWLTYWVYHSFSSSDQFNHRLSQADAPFSFVKCLSSPRTRVRPFLCTRITQGLPLPILTSGAEFFPTNSHSLKGINHCWNRVQRWLTNVFFSMPTSIPSWEACLPVIPSTAGTRDA